MLNGWAASHRRLQRSKGQCRFEGRRFRLGLLPRKKNNGSHAARLRPESSAAVAANGT